MIHFQELYCFRLDLSLCSGFCVCVCVSGYNMLKHFDNWIRATFLSGATFLCENNRWQLIFVMLKMLILTVFFWSLYSRRTLWGWGWIYVFLKWQKLFLAHSKSYLSLRYFYYCTFLVFRCKDLDKWSSTMNGVLLSSVHRKPFSL